MEQAAHKLSLGVGLGVANPFRVSDVGGPNFGASVQCFGQFLLSLKMV